MEFDPYHKWLGIPLEEQPPDHYRLLGLRVYESNPDVIEIAADRQMNHVRSFAVGPNGELSQRLLNELSKARLCLLDPPSKAAYDDELRREHGTGTATQGGVRLAKAQVQWIVSGAVGLVGVIVVLLLIWNSTSPEPKEAVQQGKPGPTKAAKKAGQKAKQGPATDVKKAVQEAKPGPTKRQGPQLAVFPFNAEQARAYQQESAARLGVPVETTNSLGMRLALIPAGRFSIGDGTDDRVVTFTQPFYMGVHEVTQAQYQAVMDGNPSKFTDDTALPVEMIDWDEAIEFCNRLSRREGLNVCYIRMRHKAKTGDAEHDVWQLTRTADGYRLPTEAEWEYACRAGSTTKYHFGNDDSQTSQYAWFRANSDGKTHPVGQKKPNPWGLFDVYGNVWESCHANVPEQERERPVMALSWIIRGASWYDSASRWGGRIKDRTPLRFSYRGHNVGLRVFRNSTKNTSQ